MTVRLLAVTFDAYDPDLLARFWGAELGRTPAADLDRAVLLPGSETQVGLRFEGSDEPRTPGPARVHLHLTSADASEQQDMVAAALARGARHLDVGQRPEEGHVVLADPEGNAFCIIEPGNNFLAGCGLLGELACDGSRDVGLFWAAALAWPLVWDENDETAVQAPAGGTKVAWGGPPIASKHGRNRQRLELVTDEIDQDVERLVALGATRLRLLGDRIELADPDGNEFVVRARE